MADHLTENEMAAIAAGLWERGETCDACDIREHLSYLYVDGNVVSIAHTPHGISPPDMHLPENLWRALDKMGDSLKLSRDWDTAGWRVVLYRDHGHANIARDASTAVAAVFAALVALYKAEHPE